MSFALSPEIILTDGFPMQTIRDDRIADGSGIMSDELQELTKPWLLALWPGIGQVAIGAGYYLMAKMGMHQVADFSPNDLVDDDRVEVKDGLIHPARLPRSRCFLWRDPEHRRDIVLIIGESHPALRTQTFCNSLIKAALQMGVERVFTFAGKATQMDPEHPSRVFAAATNKVALDEFQKLDVNILADGQIDGLNGVLLCEAAQAGLKGVCLLAEVPDIFAQMSFPGATFALLNVFCQLAGLSVDLDELNEQAADTGRKLGLALAQIETELEKLEEADTGVADPVLESDALSEPRLSVEHERHIHQLFTQARTDRSNAFELKQELDRLHAYDDYEDDFLDLFQKSDHP